jgi:DNA recombination protein RmuC
MSQDFIFHGFFQNWGIFLGAFTLISFAIFLLVKFKNKNALAFPQDQFYQEMERRMSAEERARRVPELEALLEQSRQDLRASQEQNVHLQTLLNHERKAMEEKVLLLKQAESQLLQSFKALSAEALQSNNQSFMNLANLTFEKFHQGAQGDLEARQKGIADLLTPVKEALTSVDTKIQELEKARAGAYEGLKEQVSHLMTSQKDLQKETTNLVNALKAPSVRGRWGEIQLRRVVEMAGMLAYCDFQEQVHMRGGEDANLRPDMLIRLPNGKNIIVDAKAPLSAYLEALEAPTEAIRNEKLHDHAKQVRGHIQALSSRGYWERLESSPEFVVLFLPGETFFSAALEKDPSLIEMGAEQKVILATPTTLIALLRAIAYGWRQEQVAENAKEISRLGQEFYKRMMDLTSHFGRLGRNLGQAVDAYNQTIGTFERRVLVSARRFKDLGVASGQPDLESLEPLNHTPRTLTTEGKGLEEGVDQKSDLEELELISEKPSEKTNL